MAEGDLRQIQEEAKRKRQEAARRAAERGSQSTVGTRFPAQATDTDRVGTVSSDLDAERVFNIDPQSENPIASLDSDAILGQARRNQRNVELGPDRSTSLNRGATDASGAPIVNNGRGTFSVVSGSQGGAGSQGDNTGLGTQANVGGIRPGERDLLAQADARGEDFLAARQASVGQESSFGRRTRQRNERVGVNAALNLGNTELAAFLAQQAGRNDQFAQSRLGDVSAAQAATAQRVGSREERAGRAQEGRLTRATQERASSANRSAELQSAAARRAFEGQQFVTEQAGEDLDRQIQLERVASQERTRLGTQRLEASDQLRKAVSEGAPPDEIARLTEQVLQGS